MTTTAPERPGCFGALLRLFGFGRHKDAFILATPSVPSHEPLPYRVRDNFLSPAELSFYHVLAAVVDARAVICPNVRLADVVFAPRSTRYMSYFARIAQKHVDFVLCDPQTMRPLVGIELDDASHDRPDRQQRDAFVDSVFQAAGLSLLHIRAQRGYASSEIAARITPYLSNGLSEGHAFTAFTPPAPGIQGWGNNGVAAVPFCPKCGVEMVVRTAKWGGRQGEQFYGCTNYPNCREMVPMHS
jgi:hypothetical protein